MAKSFRGVTPAARPLIRVCSITKLILRFSISIMKDWSGVPHLCRCLPVLSRWPVTTKAMAAPRSTSAASTPEMPRWLCFIGYGYEGIISIAVSNTENSCCVAVESTCLEKFEDTIGITTR